MEKLKVLIVDSSVFFKKILSRAVESTGLGQVDYTASNGVLALERLKQHPIDVVLLDQFTPEVNGMEFLETIGEEYPGIFAIMLGAGGSNTAESRRALEAGALDFIQKPPVTSAEKSIETLKKQLQGLFTQIMTMKYTSRGFCGPADAAPTKAAPCRPPVPARRPAPPKKLSGVDLVAVASSTGGPSALETFCKNLPASFSKPILVVQHMPVDLTKKMALSLDKKCRLTVTEAAEGEPILAGKVIIAPGGVHMTLQQKNNSYVIRLEDTPPVHGVKPAADVLFRSIAGVCRGKRILAVILTGMGSDGMQGVGEMKKTCECYCLAQSERTCVVYGMPKSVVEAGLADDVADLEAIPSMVVQMVAGRGL